MIKGRVLVVDDEADVRRCVRLILTKAGYDVIEAEDGEAGVKAVKSGDNPIAVDAIICDLEKGIRPWARPWHGGGGTPCRPLRNNGEPYRGVNVLWLWRQADLNGYTSPYWFTYRQAQDHGGQVRKGEKGSLLEARSFLK